MTYSAPVKDMLFNIEHLARIDQIAQLPGFEDADLGTAQAVLEESAKFNEEVLAPLNWAGDQNPSAWKNGVVTATPGFKEAYKQFAEAGWQGLQHPVGFGGQGLPIAQRRRYRGFADGGLGRTECDLPGKNR